MIDILKRKIQDLKNKKILELGAGFLDPIYNDLAKSNELIVSDIIELKRIVPIEGYAIEVIDACETGKPDNSFDVVLSSMLIQHININKHLSEVRRILKEDGKYWFAVTGREHNKELPEVMQREYNLFDELIDTNDVIVAEEEKYSITFDSISEANEYMRSIGWFGEIEKTPMKLTKHYILYQMSFESCNGDLNKY